MSEGPQTLDAGESVRVLADSLWSAQLVNHSIAQRLVEGAKGET